MNTRTQTLPLWAPPKDWAGRFRDLRSHHRRLAVNGDVVYHWKHSVVQLWNKPRKIWAPMPSRGLKPEWADFSTRNRTTDHRSVRISPACLFIRIQMTLYPINQTWYHNYPLRIGVPAFQLFIAAGYYVWSTTWCRVMQMASSAEWPDERTEVVLRVICWT